MERTLAQFLGRSDPNIPLPSSTVAIIVGLKWSLLRRIEKPLKNLDLPELSTIGIALNVITIRYQCDLKSFTDMAALISRTHSMTSGSDRSRVLFSPSLDTIQTSSLASSNYTIAFTSLPDLAMFLGIRDEKDYEKLLTKEVVKHDTTFLQIIGSYLRHDDQNERQPNNSSNSSIGSVSANTGAPSFLRLFVGSSPIKGCCLSGGSYNDDYQSSSLNCGKYHTMVYEQRCSHFSSTQMCFQSPWIGKHFETDFCHDEDDMNRAEDGEVDTFQKHFVLNWSRMTPPSTSKWTKDVQGTHENCPGSISLSIPTIYMNSNKNVTSMVKLLDEYIETHMNLRTDLPNNKAYSR